MERTEVNNAAVVVQRVEFLEMSAEIRVLSFFAAPVLVELRLTFLA